LSRGRSDEFITHTCRVCRVRDRFASTAEQYAAHRPDHDERAMAHVCERLDLDGDAWVLDLGCGTGEIALPLSARVERVVGLDPSRPTLRRARRRARVHGAAIDWVQATDAELAAFEPRFAAATVGRALHRTDRRRTLEQFRRLARGVAIVGDREWLTRGTREWQDRAYEVVAAYVDPPERTGPVEYDDPYDTVLREADYRDVRVETFDRERRLSADVVVGYVLSLSFCSPAVLGDDRRAFERDLRDALAALDPPYDYDAATRVVTGHSP